MRESLSIFILSDMVQIKRGRKSIELMPLDEADEFGRDLRLAVAAARATRPIRHRLTAGGRAFGGAGQSGPPADV